MAPRFLNSAIAGGDFSNLRKSPLITGDAAPIIHYIGGRISPETVRILQSKESCPGGESNPKYSAIILQAIHYHD